jgi:hypothetical protein
MYIGIDLALRNIGVVALSKTGNLINFRLITSDPKKINGEDLLMSNKISLNGAIYSCINANKSEVLNIGLEGLAFGSPSALIDLIAANHWITRIEIKKDGFPLTVIPPRAWLKEFVTKDVLADWAKRFPVVRAKKKMKLTKEEKAANTKSKAAIRKESKEMIYNKVPAKIREQFEAYLEKNKLPKDGKLDLSDAYHLANYIRKKNGT